METATTNASTAWKSGIEHLDELWNLNDARVLRIVKGPAGCGKTELLCQIAVSSILPKERGGIYFGGNESTVVFISNDQKVSLSRIVDLFYQRVLHCASKSIPNPASNVQSSAATSENIEVESLLKECLSRLWISRCKDSIQFKATFNALPRRLATIGKANQAQLGEPADGAQAVPQLHVTLLIDALDAYSLSETKFSSSFASHEELTRNWLYSTPHSMAIAATSDLYYVASSPSSSHLLTLSGTTAECESFSRAYRIDKDAGFVLG